MNQFIPSDYENSMVFLLDAFGLATAVVNTLIHDYLLGIGYPKYIFGAYYNNHASNGYRDSARVSRASLQYTVPSSDGRNVVLGTLERHYCWSLLF
jgi:hypothetical protein